MRADSTAAGARSRVRRDLLHQYMHLQRELIDGDPGTSAYQGTVHSFRQMGYALISAGFEDDLDRLLRIRVVEGGKSTPSSRSERSVPGYLCLIERRQA